MFSQLSSWAARQVKFVLDQNIEELMEVSTSSTDFSPFPSKLFATLFLLLHSPRPMVIAAIINYVALFALQDFITGRIKLEVYLVFNQPITAHPKHGDSERIYSSGVYSSRESM